MKKILFGAAFVATAWGMTPSFISIDAEAACCVAYRQDHVESTNENVKEHFTSEIDAMRDAITAMMARATAQLVNTLKEQVQGNSQIAQTTDQRETLRRIEETRLRAIIDAQTGPLACNAITGVAVTGGDQVSASRTSLAVTNDAEAWDTGTREHQGDSRNFNESSRETRLRANSQFCNEDMERFGLCAVSDTPAPLRGATLNPGRSLFGETSYSSAHVAATNAYLKNAINPEPQGPLMPSASDNNANEARRLFAERQAKRSRMAMAEYFIADLIGKRTPSEMMVADGEEATTQRWWAEATAADVVGYNTSGNNFPNGVSWQDYMELRSRAWYHNPEFWRQVNDGNMTHNMKVLMMMNSFMVYQNWETYKLLQQIGAIGATQLAIFAEGT